MVDMLLLEELLNVSEALSTGSSHRIEAKIPCMSFRDFKVFYLTLLALCVIHKTAKNAILLRKSISHFLFARILRGESTSSFLSRAPAQVFLNLWEW